MPPNPSTENEVEVAVADVSVSTTHEEAQETGDTNKYVKFSSVVWISIVLCLATLCVAVDNSTAVPRITDEFHSIDDVGWYAAVFHHLSIPK
jgi:hypothetical protein